MKNQSRHDDQLDHKSQSTKHETLMLGCEEFEFQAQSVYESLPQEPGDYQVKEYRQHMGTDVVHNVRHLSTLEQLVTEIQNGRVRP